MGDDARPTRGDAARLSRQRALQPPSIV
jgi:hypothetical protein